jgi:hypothetical protein
MLTEEHARQLVVSAIATIDMRALPDGCPQGCVILGELTIEKPWGWVFFYQSRAWLETRQTRHMLVGNAPYMVNRYDGSIRTAGTAYPIGYYIAEYEKTLESGQ